MKYLEGNLSDPNEYLEQSENIFKSLLKIKGRSFGDKSKPYKGVSDDNEGVQWHIALLKENSIIKLGVNLEGKKYKGWPIATFIENELHDPQLIKLAQEIKQSSNIYVRLRKDAWQYGYRIPIFDQINDGKDIKLSDITTSKWKKLLNEAQRCLDKDKGFRGRARREVVLKNSRKIKKMEVSPHLNIYCAVWRQTTPTEKELTKNIQEAFNILQPIYTFVKNQTIIKRT